MVNGANMINATTLWASQLAALNARGPVQPNAIAQPNATVQPNAINSPAGTSVMFSELLSALTSGAPTASGAGATSATSVAGVTSAASATTSADVANLKSAFNKFLADLGGVNASSIRNSLHLLA